MSLRMPALAAGGTAVVVVNARVGPSTLTPARLRAVVGSTTREKGYRNNTAVTARLEIAR